MLYFVDASMAISGSAAAAEACPPARSSHGGLALSRVPQPSEPYLRWWHAMDGRAHLVLARTDKDKVSRPCRATYDMHAWYPRSVPLPFTATLGSHTIFQSVDVHF
ncbi:hypothetical protein GQ53DRAFT_250874 [Thozetella sp. PMI_491]|nr:hypothetical protein GQ53DRAFT_250874 [Thozetella sp. PMI_491]